MYEDSLYNLMNQLVQEQKSLWRIENFYLPQVEDQDELAVWQRIAADKLTHVEELTDLIQQRL